MHGIKYRFNDLVVFDPDEATLSLGDLNDDNVIAISSVTCRLLQLFVENHGEVISRDVLFKRIWDDYGMVSGNNNLNQNISKLRKIVKTLGIDDEFISTVPKTGFVLNKEIKLDVLREVEEKTQPATSPLLDEILPAGNADESRDVSERNTSLSVTEPVSNSPKKLIPSSLLLNKKKIYLLLFISLFTLVAAMAYLLNYRTAPVANEGYLGIVNGCKVFLVTNQGENIINNKPVSEEMLRYAASKQQVCRGDEYLLIRDDALVQSYIPGVKRLFLLKCEILREHRIEMCSGLGGESNLISN
ncbi:winged helix-turn-helix domain-containing protein [Budviciaceae bacterium CWB-B4]|uniref:Winged helix-turn-helix domain-containing protein n=1 Tax=Limnobaculum xujianqingii TaxID=2738837 RepID=A0A9D7ALN9_9GAMM|nr:winged helix-turn-helix domain-containing protein [Limnobaculum xujianqingii]MBK5075123.1 winged helix-turn-helix domain-containing protein [Limnobaculum xujianqingii]MBK5178433.1 winged helix-turn-helix domain-containing protein [Limnobaculum xujianqingii]